jgi:hypothetical protein
VLQMICASAAPVKHSTKNNARRRAVIENTPLSAVVRLAEPTANQQGSQEYNGL